MNHDGRPPADAPSQKLILADFRDAYLAAHRATHETKSLYTARDPRATELPDLQRHVDRRCPEICPAAKELSTFRTASDWGVRLKHFSGSCPVKGLVYPKVDEEPPFQTRSEIGR